MISLGPKRYITKHIMEIFHKATLSCLITYFFNMICIIESRPLNTDFWEKPFQKKGGGALIDYYRDGNITEIRLQVVSLLSA